MFWFLKKDKDKPIKKMDKVVTGVILWSVIASVFWLKKYHDSKKNESAKNSPVKTTNKKTFWYDLFFKQNKSLRDKDASTSKNNTK